MLSITSMIIARSGLLPSIFLSLSLISLIRDRQPRRCRTVHVFSEGVEACTCSRFISSSDSDLILIISAHFRLISQLKKASEATYEFRFYCLLTAEMMEYISTDRVWMQFCRKCVRRYQRSIMLMPIFQYGMMLNVTSYPSLVLTLSLRKLWA